MGRIGPLRRLLARAAAGYLLALAIGAAVVTGLFWSPVRPLLPGDIEAEVVLRFAAIAGAGFVTAALAGWMAAWLLVAPTAAVLGQALLLARALGRSPFNSLDATVHPRAAVEATELAAALYQAAARVQLLLDHQARERDELTALIASMAEGVVVTDAQGKVVLTNPAAAHLLGSPLTGGKPLVELVRDYEVHQLVERCIRSGQPERGELEAPVTQRFLGVTAMPVAGTGDGRILLVIHDLSEVRRVERTRREFVANVSHELRTPLTTIKASVETLQEGALDDPPAARTFLGRIDGEVDRMTLLVADLLELSRLESGQMTPRLTPVNLAILAEEAIDRLRSRAQRKQLTLVDAVSGETPPVLADPDMLRQVLSNLLENAVKYTAGGGSVTISAAVLGTSVVTSVADTGIGIAREHLPHVFERFYKVERARREGGTGLGLAIVKHIVQVHGGEVRVESREGEGSTFSFSLTIPPAGS